MTENENSPMLIEQIKSMSFEELNDLAAELRQELISNVSVTGGHLASNLGVVELTIALHRVFDAPEDKIVWDVGHQCYVHKMLTGRRDQMLTLRQSGGLSGFPKRRESEFDTYDSGHSGTSVSAALGYATANALSGEKHSCVAVIGDGAMTGGVSFEAFNAAGSSKTPLIVVLNDNGMSISKNVGGLAKNLQIIRTGSRYLRFKSGVKNVFRKTPGVVDALRSFRNRVKHMLLPGNVFEELGFKYYGPVDGHDIAAMCRMFEAAKAVERPVVVHCVTQKGKGFAPAEQNPSKYHGTGPFDPETADAIAESNPDSWSETFGRILLENARQDSSIVAVTAAMADGTGVFEMQQEFPERVFDAAIAEQHAVSFAAGLALSGLKPVVAIYSTFLQRAYDQLLSEVCLQQLPVIFAVDRAGVVGADGETHQGLYDIEFFNSMPGMTVLSPRDGKELEKMFAYALKLGKPCAIRYPRGRVPVLPIAEGVKESYLPQPECLTDGIDLAIVSDGASLPYALKAAKILQERRISCAVWDIKQIKPLNERFLAYAYRHWKKIVCIEDGAISCGMGARIAAASGTTEVLCIAWPDRFIEHGKPEELRHKYGLDAEAIADRTEKFLENKA